MTRSTLQNNIPPPRHSSKSQELNVAPRMVVRPQVPRSEQDTTQSPQNVLPPPQFRMTLRKFAVTPQMSRYEQAAEQRIQHLRQIYIQELIHRPSWTNSNRNVRQFQRILAKDHRIIRAINCVLRQRGISITSMSPKEAADLARNINEMLKPRATRIVYDKNPLPIDHINHPNNPANPNNLILNPTGNLLFQISIAISASVGNAMQEEEAEEHQANAQVQKAEEDREEEEYEVTQDEKLLSQCLVGDLIGGEEGAVMIEKATRGEVVAPATKGAEESDDLALECRMPGGV